jgi:L-serine dehydratase
MIFELVSQSGNTVLSETYFSIGGGFINTLEEISQLVALIFYAASACFYISIP